MIPLIDRENEMVLGHVELTDLGVFSHLPNDSAVPNFRRRDEEKLDAALDFESTGRRQTAAKALHLMARGAHVSGFVLRPDDALSDVAIVSNGATRFLSPGEMEWLMHGPPMSIVVGDDDRLSRLKDAVRSALEFWDALGWTEAESMARPMGDLREALWEVSK